LDFGDASSQRSLENDHDGRRRRRRQKGVMKEEEKGG
jgi:hypothetical protein